MEATMKSPEVQFTPEDRLILDSYCQMLDGLAQYLGTGYELVLHSLEDLEHSAIRVMNSHTGRSEGAPITELALTMLDVSTHRPRGIRSAIPAQTAMENRCALVRSQSGAVNSESSGYCVSIFIWTPRFRSFWKRFPPHRASL